MSTSASSAGSVFLAARAFTREARSAILVSIWSFCSADGGSAAVAAAAIRRNKHVFFMALNLTVYILTKHSDSDITVTDCGGRFKLVPSFIAGDAAHFAFSCGRGPARVRDHAGGSAAVRGAVQARTGDAVRQPAEAHEPGAGGGGRGAPICGRRSAAA